MPQLLREDPYDMIAPVRLARPAAVILRGVDCYQIWTGHGDDCNLAHRIARTLPTNQSLLNFASPMQRKQYR
jgi:hypothetical protein